MTQYFCLSASPAFCPSSADPTIFFPIVSIADYDLGLITIEGLPPFPNGDLQQSQLARRVIALKRLWSTGDRNGTTGYHSRRKHHLPIENDKFRLRITPTFATRQDGTVVVTLLRDYGNPASWGRPAGNSQRSPMTAAETDQVFRYCLEQCVSELNDYFLAADRLAIEQDVATDFYNAPVPQPFYSNLPFDQQLPQQPQ